MVSMEGPFVPVPQHATMRKPCAAHESNACSRNVCLRKNRAVYLSRFRSDLPETLGVTLNEPVLVLAPVRIASLIEGVGEDHAAHAHAPADEDARDLAEVDVIGHALAAERECAVVP